MQRIAVIVCAAIVSACTPTPLEGPSPVVSVRQTPPAAPRAASAEGLRLVYGVTPASEDAVQAALGAVRERLDPLTRGLEIAIRNSGMELIVELGPSPAGRVVTIKQAMLRSDALSIAPCDDMRDPLAKVPPSEVPSDIELDREVAHVGPHLPHQIVYARISAIDEEARTRLLEWVRGRLDPGMRLALGRSDFAGEPVLRSYFLAAEPVPLDVSETALVDDAIVSVQLTLAPESAKTFARITADNVDKRVAILIGDEVQTAPRVMEAITGGTLVITLPGPHPIREAKMLMRRLERARSPIRLELLREELFEAAPQR